MSKNSDISEELKELNSILQDSPKTMPYDVPHGYFEELANHVQKELSLSHSDKEQPFSVPQGYFENLANNISKRVEEPEDLPETTQKRIWFPLRMAAAAVLLICVTIGTYLIIENQTTSISAQLADIPADEINEYLQNNFYEYDLATLEQAVASAETTPVVSEEDLTSSEIEQYIDYQGWEE